jgi:hypothetical protein
MALKTIFPDNSYNDSASKVMKQRIEDFYTNSISQNMNFWAEADIDSRFESGDQNVWRELYPSRTLPYKHQFNFNRIKRVVNLASGFQRRNRKSTIVAPVENGDMQTADQFTKIIMHINRQESVLETISESFQNALVSGLSLMQLWVDYRKDPISGEIKVDNCPYNTFIIDPFFKKPDLSDCNAIWKRNFLTQQECLSLLPEFKEQILELKNKTANKDGKFQYMPENFNVNMGQLYTYDEYYYRDYRTQLILIDAQTGETLEWAGQDDERLALYLQTYPTVKMTSVQIPTVRLAILIQGKVIFDGLNPIGIDTYPFVPVFGYFTPQLQNMSQRIQGMVRGLRDPQFLYNTMKGLELEFVQNRVNPGFIYKASAMVNPLDIYMRDLGKGIALNDSGTIADVQQIVPPDFPASWAQLAETYSKEIMEISAVNEELLGSATDDKAGILSMLRQGGGLTTLQTLFDQLDRSQKILGQLEIAAIQTNYTPGKIKRIIEEEPTQQFYNKSFGRYDAAVEEGVNTTTQRQMQFAQLMNLKELGVPIPDSTIIEASTLQNKKQLIESLGQSLQAKQQQEQQMLQVQMQLQQAQIELAQARADADRGLRMERESRVYSNMGLMEERDHNAKKDDADATLSIIKAIKELEGLDIEHINKLLGMLKMMEQPAEPKDMKTEMMSSAIINEKQPSESQVNPLPTTF